MRLCACLFALGLSLIAQTAAGELPPGSYVKLRKSAPVVLKVQVTSATADKDDVAALHKVALGPSIWAHMGREEVLAALVG